MKRYVCPMATFAIMLVLSTLGVVAPQENAPPKKTADKGASKTYQAVPVPEPLVIKPPRKMLQGTVPSVVLKAKRGNAKTYLPNALLHRTKRSATTSFDVTFSPNTPQEAKDAFNYAFGIWQLYLQSNVPIVVKVNWTPLNLQILGSARPTLFLANFPNSPAINTFYPIALANKLANVDLKPSDTDIECSFNSDAPWYFGLDGAVPANQYDLATVVLHEIGHGLGFSGTGQINSSGTGEIGFVISNQHYPAAFDPKVEAGNYARLINPAVFPNPSALLADALTSNNLWYHDDTLDYRYQLYAPKPFEPGSSFSHLDEHSFPAGDPNSLMTPQLMAQEAIHDPGPLTLNIFRNLGWHNTEYPIFTSTTSNGVIQCYGRAAACRKIMLNGVWTAEVNAQNVVIVGSDTAVYDASKPRSFFYSTKDGYVAFSCGSGVLSSLEFGDFQTTKAYYAENLMRGVPYKVELTENGQPITAAARFELLRMGTQIGPSPFVGRPVPRPASTPTQRMVVTTENLGTTSGKVVLATPDGRLTITCQRYASQMGGTVDISYDNQTILNVWGDPHLKVPAQANATFQQGDRELLLICPDGRTAVWLKTLNVCRISDRIIEEITVFDTDGEYWVHQITGLNTMLPLDYAIATQGSQYIASNIFYSKMPTALQGDLAFLSTTGKMLGYNKPSNTIMDYEQHLEDRCARKDFNPAQIDCIVNQLGKTLVQYYIEASGRKDGVSETWMRRHADMFQPTKR